MSTLITVLHRCKPKQQLAEHQQKYDYKKILVFTEYKSLNSAPTSA